MAEKDNTPKIEATLQQQATQPIAPTQPPLQQVMVQPAGNDGFAITSLVTGILTIVTAWLWPLSLILGILGLTFGIISYSKKKSGMALAGIICAAVGLVLMILFIVFVIILADDVITNSPNYYY
jgi:hypothetical protein